MSLSSSSTVVGRRLQLAVLYVVAVASISEAVLLNARAQQRSEIIVAAGEDLNFAREKRAAKTSEAAEVSSLATAVHLNNSHLHLMVHWAGQGSPVVFCLGRDQVSVGNLVYQMLELVPPKNVS